MRPQLLMARVMQPIPMMFITTPVLACAAQQQVIVVDLPFLSQTGGGGALTMSDTLRKPEEKTMALGGVATGSMKAKEALSVQGIMTYSGFRLMDWDWTRTQNKTCFYSAPTTTSCWHHA